MIEYSVRDVFLRALIFCKQPTTLEYPLSTKIVRAIDAGYGLTKFIQAVNPDGSLVCKQFPSMAVPSDPATMRSLNVRQRNTIDVMVGNASYEVGYDVLQAQTGNDVGREIGESWSSSDMYRAVMLGALHYMGLDKIDTLVLGLPVNQYLSEDRCKKLADEYRGTLDLPGGHKVTIGDVVIRPQPFGGYIESGNHIDQINATIRAMSQNGTPATKELTQPADLINENCVLVVDPGEHTLDWLLVDRGVINTKASGAASDSGRHRIVRDVQRAIEKDLDRQINPANLPRINESLRTGSPLKLGGQLVDLAKYATVVAQSVADPISRLIEGLRGLEDRIDIVLVVGGHPDIYERALRERFPYTPVVVLDDSLHANVRGFQRMGEALAEAQ
jgi:plasmid segregation protein ParM